MVSGRKAEKKALQAVRSADREYTSFKKRMERPGIAKAEYDYTARMADHALQEANKVRRFNHYPPYGVSDEDYREQRRQERWSRDE
jgi:hypothetical protein